MSGSLGASHPNGTAAGDDQPGRLAAASCLAGIRELAVLQNLSETPVAEGQQTHTASHVVVPPGHGAVTRPSLRASESGLYSEITTHLQVDEELRGLYASGLCSGWDALRCTFVGPIHGEKSYPEKSRVSSHELRADGDSTSASGRRQASI